MTISGVNWKQQLLGRIRYQVHQLTFATQEALVSAKSLSNTSSTHLETHRSKWPLSDTSSHVVCAGAITRRFEGVVHALGSTRAGRSGSLITGTPLFLRWRQSSEPEAAATGNNTTGRATKPNSSAGPRVRTNVHYFNNTPSSRSYAVRLYRILWSAGKHLRHPLRRHPPATEHEVLQPQQRLNQLRQRRQQLQ